MYLKQRHKTWWAVHDIPRALQPTLGRRFTRSLGTHDRAKAQRLANAIWLHDWSRKLQSGLADTPRADDAEAAIYRELLAETKSAEEREVLQDHVADIYSDRHDRFTTLAEKEASYRQFKVATGKLNPTGEHVTEWLVHAQDTDKTKVSKRAVLGRFAAAFPYLEEVETKKAQAWLTELTKVEGLSASTVVRYMAFLRGYWRHLQDAGIVDSNPLRDLRTPALARKKTSWVPFAATDVVSLVTKASAKGDQELADLITMGMYTGARIEELCSLPVADVDLERRAFTIKASKTQAGLREVPIHPSLHPVLRRLIGDRKTGYVLAGLKSGSQYGDRSDAIRKRFARLRDDAGFDARYVFHSIRKTVGTLLENAGVSENIAADILGHEKPRITYKIYSGGASLEVKRVALEKLRY